MAEKKGLPVRAYLIHMTHYDPAWFDKKAGEKPFDVALGCDMVRALAKAGFNVLIVDLEDGVEYAGFPELKRHYTSPKASLDKLLACAQEQGIEVVPKLNFSKGPTPRSSHNEWFRPFNEPKDTPKFWEDSFRLIDEVIAMVKPKRFFFIGMDEDFLRTPDEYVAAVNTLAEGLKKRGLRAVMWNDTLHLGASMYQCVEKTLAAEDRSPKDVAHVVWNYRELTPRCAERVRQMKKKGLEVWIAPGREAKLVEDWKKLALQTGCEGMVMTAWTPVQPDNRAMFMNLIEKCGPIYSRKDVPAAEIIMPEEKPGPKPNRITRADMKTTKGTKDEVLAPNNLTEPLAEMPYLLPAEVYVRNWMVLGPYPFDQKKYPGKFSQEVIDDAGFLKGPEGELVAQADGTKAHGATWRRYQPKPGMAQIVDINHLYGLTEFAVAYLVAHVHCERAAKDYIFYTGSDDYIKVWVNGQHVHTFAETFRGVVQDDDKVEGIALAKGWNKIVVKCVNLKAGWAMALRIADGKDRALVTR